MTISTLGVLVHVTPTLIKVCESERDRGSSSAAAPLPLHSPCLTYTRIERVTALCTVLSWIWMVRTARNGKRVPIRPVRHGDASALTRRLFHLIKKLAVYLTHHTTEDAQKMYVRFPGTMAGYFWNSFSATFSLVCAGTNARY